MTIQNAPLSFTLWTPLPEAQPSDCPICLESLSGEPTTADLVPMKHEGPLGAQHPMHLGCCLDWMKKSNLCSYCKGLLNTDQLTLLLDALQNRDITVLSAQDLEAETTLAKAQSETPDGKLKSRLIPLDSAKKTLDLSLVALKDSSKTYEATLEKAMNQLTIQLEATSMKAYLRYENVLLRIDSSEIPQNENTYNDSLRKTNDLFKEYRKACIEYAIKDFEAQGRRLAAQELMFLFKIESPLGCTFGEAASQRSFEYLIAKETLWQINHHTQRLTNRYKQLKQEKTKYPETLRVVFAILGLWGMTDLLFPEFIPKDDFDLASRRLVISALSIGLLSIALISSERKKAKNFIFHTTLQVSEVLSAETQYLTPYLD